LIRSENQNTGRVEDKLAVLTNANERISYLRAKVINALINKSIQLYQANFSEIMAGTLDKSLLDIYKSGNRSLQEIESFSIEEIYNHKAVVEIENAGYNRSEERRVGKEWRWWRR